MVPLTGTDKVGESYVVVDMPGWNRFDTGGTKFSGSPDFHQRCREPLWKLPMDASELEKSWVFSLKTRLFRTSSVAGHVWLMRILVNGSWKVSFRIVDLPLPPALHLSGRFGRWFTFKLWCYFTLKKNVPHFWSWYWSCEKGPTKHTPSSRQNNCAVWFSRASRKSRSQVPGKWMEVKSRKLNSSSISPVSEAEILKLEDHLFLTSILGFLGMQITHDSGWWDGRICLIFTGVVVLNIWNISSSTLFGKSGSWLEDNDEDDVS